MRALSSTSPVFPTTRFRVPMLAAYYGLGLFLDSYDHSFVDVTRVYIDGHSQGITPNADGVTADASFTDPMSGKTYTAVRSMHADAGLFHPAHFMIGQLKAEFLDTYNGSTIDLQADYNYSDYQFLVDKLELLRGMNYTYDYGTGE